MTSLSYTSPFDRDTCKILCISCNSVLRPMSQLSCHMRNQDLHAPSPIAKCPEARSRPQGSDHGVVLSWAGVSYRPCSKPTATLAWPGAAEEEAGHPEWGAGIQRSSKPFLHQPPAPLPPAFLTACDAGHSWPLEVILQPPGGSVAVHLLQRRREALRGQLPAGLRDTHTCPNMNSNPHPGPLCPAGSLQRQCLPDAHQVCRGSRLSSPLCLPPFLSPTHV